MVIHLEEPADGSRFIDIFKAKDLPGKDMWPRQQSFVWNYDKNTEEAEAEKLLSDAKLLEDAGCYAIVLEKIPAALAEKVAKELRIPVIGIGAGGGVDGQVLVFHDMTGITQGFSPRFLRRYANIGDVITDAVKHYVSDVKSRDFPNEQEQY